MSSFKLELKGKNDRLPEWDDKEDNWHKQKKKKTKTIALWN